MNNPVFISLLYRSGSTLLSLILDQSNEISSTSDTIHFMRFSYNKYLPIEENYKTLVEDTASRIKEKWGFELNQEDVLKRVSEHSKISQAVVYDSLVRSFLNLNNSQRWCDRTAVGWERIPDFLEMFPNGKALHIYRDPRAVLLSFKKYTFLKEPAYLDSIFASSALFNFLNRKSIKENPNIFQLKYEDLVAEPENEIKTLCNFLEIEYTPKMLDVKNFKDKFGNSFDGNSSHFKGKSKIDNSSVNIWKNQLSKVEIYFTEHILGKELDWFGYEKENLELNKDEQIEFNELVEHPYIAKRYNFFLNRNT